MSRNPNPQPVDPASRRRAFDALRRSLEESKAPYPSERGVRVEGSARENSQPCPNEIERHQPQADQQRCEGLDQWEQQSHQSPSHQLQKEADHRVYQTAYERAVRYLAAREHSEKELLNKLCARGETDVELAGRVVDQLKDLNLQSDQRFAESLVRSRISRGQGPIRIRQELVRKGVGDELLEEVLTRSGDFWVGIAVRAREKRFGDTLPQDRSAWNKQARFLAGRGFPSDLIYRVLGNLG